MVRRAIVVVVALAAGPAGLAGGPAWAHVEVEADKPRAGAEDVTLTFTGEAESSTAGITSERVVLPPGIAVADVALMKAPKGWEFTAGSDGFTVGGTALKVGEDAVFAVKVVKLPTDVATLSFKTLETYGDGKVSRWIDLPQPGEPEPDSPAPTITLKGAAAPASAPSTPSASLGPAPSEAPSTPSATGPSSAPPNDPPAEASTLHAGWWAAAGVAAVLVLAGLILHRRRKS
jgi:hypothetical protein